MTVRASMVALLALACSGSDKTDTDTDSPADTDTDTDTDSDTDSDTDTDTDSDTDSDTDTDTEQVLKVFEGTAVVNGAFDGTESVTVIGDEGYGDVVCQISYDLDSIGTRSDCAVCEWAYDVAISNVVVATDEGGACLTYVGVDAASATSLDGTTYGYGYDPEYFGHAEVMITDRSGGWNATAYVQWDELTYTLTYDWDDIYGAL